MKKREYIAPDTTIVTLQGKYQLLTASEVYTGVLGSRSDDDMLFFDSPTTSDDFQNDAIPNILGF